MTVRYDPAGTAELRGVDLGMQLLTARAAAMTGAADEAFFEQVLQLMIDEVLEGPVDRAELESRLAVLVGGAATMAMVAAWLAGAVSSVLAECGQDGPDRDAREREALARGLLDPEALTMAVAMIGSIRRRS